MATPGIRNGERARNGSLQGEIASERKTSRNSPAKGNGRSLRSFTVSGSRVPRFEILNYASTLWARAKKPPLSLTSKSNAADGRSRLGCRMDTNIEFASIRAVLSALNRS